MHSPNLTRSRPQLFNAYSMAGFGATLVGNGIGRFAYIAMMPALIHAGWFDEAQASYLGAATLIGYILGAPLCQYLTHYFTAVSLIRVAMLLSSLSFLGCALQDISFSYYFLLRAMAGLTGAMLMILAPPLIVRLHPPETKARISGIIFSGIGLGVMLAGCLLPIILQQSISAAWLLLAAITFATTFATWSTWQKTETNSNFSPSSAKLNTLSKSQQRTLGLLVCAYAFDAIGYLPHTLFWVDFIVRDLDRSLTLGGAMWAIFGVGAALGPILVGSIGDKLDLKLALCSVFLLKATGVLLPTLTTNLAGLMLSSLLVGLFTTGVVALISAYTLECVGYELNTKAWGMLTMAFALSQGVFGYLYAYLAPQITNYQPLFITSTCALVLAAVLTYFSHPKSLRKPNETLLK